MQISVPLLGRDIYRGVNATTVTGLNYDKPVEDERDRPAWLGNIRLGDSGFFVPQ
jgi:hypothetical protein